MEGGLTYPTRSLPRAKRSTSMRTIRIAILGCKGVGKSAVTVRFLTKRFIGEYDQSSDNKYIHHATIDNENVTFEVMDTCTQPSLNSGTSPDDPVKWADCYVLVYDVTKRGSIDTCRDIKANIAEVKRIPQQPMVLIGNKSDLGHLRQITKAQGETTASELGCPFLEVSAADDLDGVQKVFQIIYREFLAYKHRSKNSFFDRVFGGLNKK